MTFEELYEKTSFESWGKHTVADLEKAYSAGVQAERERLRLLAEAVLEAHSKHYPVAYHVGCPACKVAREVLSE